MFNLVPPCDTFEIKAHFRSFFRASRDHIFMYYRQRYYGSEISLYMFGFFEKFFYVSPLIDLVTLDVQNKIKTKRTFSEFSIKYSWPNIAFILSPLIKMKTGIVWEIESALCSYNFRRQTLQSRPGHWLHQQKLVNDLRTTDRVTRLERQNCSWFG